MIRLLALGDICPGDHYFTLGHGLGSRLAAGWQPLAPVAARLRAADLVIANLEGVLAESSAGEGPVDSNVFRGPPAAAAQLRSAGVDVMHVANNHALQHGEAAFRSSLEALAQAGISPLGVPGNGFACAPVIRHVGDTVAGFLGYSRVTERHLPEQTLYAAPSPDEMIADVRALSHHVDTVIVSIHWGDEGVELPAPAVIDLGRSLIEAGAQVVLGHHPHVFQPVMRHGNGLVAFSLGNALFDLFWHQPLVESALLEIALEAGREPEFDLTPVRFGRNYLLELQEGRAAAAFLDRVDNAASALANLDRAAYASIYARRLKAVERALRWRKLGFFLGNLARGATRHKARFLCRKLAARRAGP